MTVADRASASYDPRFVSAATKAGAFELLAALRTRIEALDDFDRFPEGPLGVVLYTLLAEEAHICPDAGDFTQVVQAVTTATAALSRIVSADTFR